MEHGEANFPINRDDVKQLRLCEHRVEVVSIDGRQLHSVAFCKFTVEGIERIEFAHAPEGELDFKVDVTVRITAKPPPKGRHEWDFELSYVQPHPTGLVLIEKPQVGLWARLPWRSGPASRSGTDNSEE